MSFIYEESAYMLEITLKELQKIELAMLLDFDRVCRKHNLRYSLAYGTLLGAVRHKGYIPWDDDIDIMMPREDYETLLTLADEQYEDGYEVWEHRKTEGYVHPIAKMVNTKTVLVEKLNIDKVKPLGVYLDIFPLDKISNDKTEQTALYNRCLKNAQHLAFSVLRFRKTGNPIKNIFKIIILAYYHLRGPRPYLKTLDKIINECDVLQNNLLKVIVFPEQLENAINGNEFDDLCELEFEGHYLYAIRNYDQWLTSSYGNYMQPPTEEHRVRTHDTITYWK